MKLKIEHIFIVIIFLCLSLPAIFINTRKDVVSDIDNRKLVELPKIEEEKYFKKFEKALSDRIGFRSSFIKLYTQVNDFFLKTMVHPTYTYGKDGYVFFHVHKNIEYGEFHHNFALMVLKLQKYCEERGIKFYFLFDPEKLSVYREFLPKGVYYNDEWVTKFTSELDSLGVNYIDNTNLLREKSKTEQVFNKKYDAGHWNDLGMFYGMNNLFSKMHNDFSNIRELSINDFDVSTRIEKNLPVSYFPIKEKVPVFKSKLKFTNLTNQYSKDMDLNNQFRHFHYYKNETAENLPKILVFQGSYLNRNGNFIINNSSEEIGIHNYQNVLDAPKYINLYKPDAVVFEVAEYTFSNTYFDLEKMKNLEFPEAFNVLESFRALNTEIKNFVIKGDAVDKIVISKSIQNIKSAWLKIDNEIYDLNNDSGYLSTFVKRNTYNQNTVCELFYKEANEKLYKTMIKLVTSNSSVLNEESASTGTLIDDNKFVFETNVVDNKFNAVYVQLYNPRTNVYSNTCSTSKENIKNFIYFHSGDTGEYTLRLKANSNKNDEFVSYKVYLENGRNYLVNLDLEYFDSKKVIVRNFSFVE